LGLDKVTTSGFGDFNRATSIASNMVKIYGMSENMGIRVVERSENGDNLSPQIQEQIDLEINKILQESYDRTKTILTTHESELKLIADNLLIHETLDFDQIKSLIENHKTKNPNF
jgi:ATP-dependent Zn protease